MQTFPRLKCLKFERQASNNSIALLIHVLEIIGTLIGLRDEYRPVGIYLADIVILCRIVGDSACRGERVSAQWASRL